MKLLDDATLQQQQVAFQGLKTSLAEKMNTQFACRESLNSSGTVSRKTSTASEYTPEHTYVHDTRPLYTETTAISYAPTNTETSTIVTDSMSIPVVQADVNDGKQKVDVKIVHLENPEGSDAGVGGVIESVEGVAAKPTVTIPPLGIDTSGGEGQGQLKVQTPKQRKISIFLVSPVNSGQLELPPTTAEIKEKEVGYVLVFF